VAFSKIADNCAGMGEIAADGDSQPFTRGIEKLLLRPSIRNGGGFDGERFSDRDGGHGWSLSDSGHVGT